MIFLNTGRKRKASGGSDSDSSDSSGSDDSSGSSGSSSEDSDSDGEDVKDSGKGVATGGGVTTAGSEPSKPKIPIDANIPGATCKACSGDRRRNLKTHKPEVMLRYSFTFRYISISIFMIGNFKKGLKNMTFDAHISFK